MEECRGGCWHRWRALFRHRREPSNNISSLLKQDGIGWQVEICFPGPLLAAQLPIPCTQHQQILQPTSSSAPTSSHQPVGTWNCLPHHAMASTPTAGGPLLAYQWVEVPSDEVVWA